MSDDLIRRSDAIKAMDERYALFGSERIKARKALEAVPSIEIIHCRECRWGKPYSDKQLKCDALGLGGLKFPDDFCSYGCRKEE